MSLLCDLLFFVVCFLLGCLFQSYREWRITHKDQSDFATYAKKEFNRDRDRN
jgi:hypothetical protein